MMEHIYSLHCRTKILVDNMEDEVNTCVINILVDNMEDEVNTCVINVHHGNHTLIRR